MQFDYRKVADPTFFSENCLPAHSDHSFYKTFEECLQGKSSFVHSLNDLWKFSYAKNYHCAIPGFEKLEYSCQSWDDIRVPAHIQMEGYDVPQYANVQYPWDGHEQIDPGQIPENFNPVASYVKHFALPEGFSRDCLRISFQGVESAFALWLNGQYVGYSEDTFTPSDFDLSPYAREGENKLAVQVFKWSSASWIEDQDFYRFSGIFRDVFLYTTPAVHVEDVRIDALLDDQYVNGQLKISIKGNGTPGKAVATLRGETETLLTLEGELGEAECLLKADVFGPKLWSAEDPNLYILAIEIFSEAGALQEVIIQHVGFRRFELKDTMMHLNGQRIVFKGTNRHEFGSLHGRVMSREDTELDFITMKRNNINAVRTSHYPNNSFFYELADIYGLYVIDEANLESHGSWDTIRQLGDDISVAVPGDRPEWEGAVLDRVNNVYQRDKNHPCVLIWSCGNESFGGKNIYEMAQLFRKLDSTRLVHYEGVFWDRRYNDSSDMESQMYTSAEKVEEYLKNDRSKPFILCEFAHAMGNSCGAMHYYTELTEREPLFQGGFIWDYIDQSILKKDRYGKLFQAYGGDFGERPTDYAFSGNGIVYGDRTPTPKMQEVKYVYQGIQSAINRKSITVTNRNLFLSTGSYDCVVTLKKEGQLLASLPMETDVPPLGVKEYPLPLALPHHPGEYVVTVSFRLKENMLWAKAGHEVAFDQYVLDIPAEKIVCGEPLTLVRGRHNIGVQGENFEALFSRLNGGLVSYRWGGKEMLDAIPMPNFWRAPTDNDYGNHMPSRYSEWLPASRYASHIPMGNPFGADYKKVPQVTEEENSVTVAYTYFLPTKPASECRVAYTVAGDGTVSVALSYDPVEGLEDMPEFGMLLRMDADYDRIQWYGLGPDETYSDRMKGGKLDVFEGTVKEQMARYIVPQECGNKVGVRWAKITDAWGRGLLFSADSMEFSALPYSPFELENAKHYYELPEIHHTVIRASMKRMGVAGDDGWGARPHPEYLLPAGKPLRFTFAFKGI